ncbi:hypothetical protein GCM10028806_14460 [Spirosoma terrae]|uniref:Phosphatase PAP2 family protein n=1 Tax=Spirosoma terrae TaxID=1968276 RepID=A0A6L9L399_9BACT|nr:phosphatase PAP2 family protein [Spirosoma terrae]NDU95095.1 phosphatase PAP2 family protein [Spirosoma terrae]
MPTTSSILYKLANLISTIGHPLLMLSVFVVFVSFQQLPIQNAVLISGLLIGVVVLPVCLQNYRKVRQGTYTNFDVSDRQQRSGFYPGLIGLVALVTGIFIATNQPLSFCYGMNATLLLLVISYGVNFFIKASLHTSLSFFLAWAIGLISPPLGVAMGIMAVAISASRLVLKRHSLIEVGTGALIGLIIGACFYRLTNTPFLQ